MAILDTITVEAVTALKGQALRDAWAQVFAPRTTASKNSTLLRDQILAKIAECDAADAGDDGVKLDDDFVGGDELDAAVDAPAPDDVAEVQVEAATESTVDAEPTLTESPVYHVEDSIAFREAALEAGVDIDGPELVDVGHGAAQAADESMEALRSLAPQATAHEETVNVVKSDAAPPLVELDAPAPRERAPRTSAPRTPAAPRETRLPPVGTKIEKKDRAGNVRCACEITDEGVLYNGKLYETLSGAGLASMKDLGLNSPTCNGFAWWGLTTKAPTERAATKRSPLPAIDAALVKYIGLALTASESGDDSATVRAMLEQHRARVTSSIDLMIALIDRKAETESADNAETASAGGESHADA